MSRTVYYTNYRGETASCQDWGDAYFDPVSEDTFFYLPNGPYNTEEECENQKIRDVAQIEDALNLLLENGHQELDPDIVFLRHGMYGIALDYDLESYLGYD